MGAVTRALMGILGGLAVVNGGYWEFRHHVWPGVAMAILGIIALIWATGANVGHMEHDRG